MGIINKDFISEVQAGKHVFGSPDTYIKEKIKKLEKKINESESIKTGEFYMQDKELRSELSILKAKRVCLEAAGEYFLTLLNKCNTEPWRNAILFCNIAFGFEIKEEEGKEEESLPSFINANEFNSLINTSSNSYDEDDGEEIIYDFALQTKYRTYIININTSKTSDKLPLFVVGNEVSSPNSYLFDLSKKSDNFGDLDYKLMDVIYNKTGALILKNDNWANARSMLIHISDFKKAIEKDSVIEMVNIERYRHLDFLYSHFLKKKESSFYRTVNNNLKGENL